MKKRIALATVAVLVLTIVAACASHHTAYSHSILSRQQRKHVDEAIEDIANKNTLPRMDVWGSNMYDVTESQLLNRLLAIEDLDSLARTHPSPAVRATTGIILIERAPQTARRLLADLLSDTSTLMITTYGFCIATQNGNTVGNTLFSYALDHNFYSRKELASVDSLILSDPDYRHLDRYHKITRTPIPREMFFSDLKSHPWRSGRLRPEVLTDNRLIADTLFFYRQALQTLHMQGTPRCYLLDVYWRDFKGYTLVQLYLAEPDRLALLLIDGKYDIVDTLTIARPLREQPLNDTDTLFTCSRFVVKRPPVAISTEELTTRRNLDETLDTLSRNIITHSYDLDFKVGRFAFREKSMQYLDTKSGRMILKKK
jgi:hypothetical protein